jgi:hypothetical protein
MYGTIAGWRAYATARGNGAPASATDPLATAALVRASDMIRLRYVPNLLPGYAADFTPTGHDLPLTEEGAYIAAGYELTTPGFFSRSYTAAEQKVLIQVQSIRWQVTGDASKTYAAMPVSTLIEAMFGPYTIDRDANGFALMSIGGGGCA